MIVAMKPMSNLFSTNVEMSILKLVAVYYYGHKYRVDFYVQNVLTGQFSHIIIIILVVFVVCVRSSCVGYLVDSRPKDMYYLNKEKQAIFKKARSNLLGFS